MVVFFGRGKKKDNRIMADKNTVYMSEKQKVKEITDKLEAGLKELLKVKNIKAISAPCQNFIITVLTIRC